ncbi:hypothetical protein [Methanoculleus sp.]|uniref:hypothetical protein n=1 Tax=Methanoculleus sp. TaxID=90427 RepID=UPI001BD34CFB|nr:hypothetical protein [Methanoculleus sp.]
MHRRLPVALFVLVIALVFLSGCFSEEPHYISRSYDYSLGIRTATPIENVTLLVPIPTCGDRPALGPVPITAEFYDPDNDFHSSYPLRIPDHYTLAVIPIDGRYYLQLTAPFMDPAEPVSMIYHNYTPLADELRLGIVPQMINTLHPLGNESLFSPKHNLTLTAGSPDAVQTSGAYNPDGYRYSYTIPVYAYYENGTRVEIDSSISGVNEWGEGFDYHPSNRYSDSYSLTITGDPQGWMPAEGEVTAGQEVYREWQLNLSPTSGSGG